LQQPLINNEEQFMTREIWTVLLLR